MLFIIISFRLPLCSLRAWRNWSVCSSPRDHSLLPFRLDVKIEKFSNVMDAKLKHANNQCRRVRRGAARRLCAWALSLGKLPFWQFWQNKAISEWIFDASAGDESALPELSFQINLHLCLVCKKLRTKSAGLNSSWPIAAECLMWGAFEERNHTTNQSAFVLWLVAPNETPTLRHQTTSRPWTMNHSDCVGLKRKQCELRQAVRASAAFASRKFHIPCSSVQNALPLYVLWSKPNVICV